MGILLSHLKGTGDEDVLNEAEIDVITNEVCDQKWEDGSGRVGLIKESHICVGNGLPEGACNVSIVIVCIINRYD